MASSRKSRLVNLPERVAAQIAPLLPAHSTILVGLSGGVDSVVLLHLLDKLSARFSWQISALHVHHGISPNADRWSDFCADLCASLRIFLHIEHVDIAPLREHGIEAAARKLRHAAFARQPCDFVAVAHHADDQVETLLLQLLRGSGVRGASAMPVLSLKEPLAIRLSCQETPVKPPVMPKQPQMPGLSDSIALVRPLLHCSRREILEYASAHQLRWIEDESNADDNYPRNFLRHRVLPLLGERFPAYRDTLTRSARHFAEATMLLDELARQDGAGKMAGGTIAAETLRSLDPARAKNLLRYFLHDIGAPMPQLVQLDDMLNQLCNARQDAAVCVNYSGWQVRRYQGRVHALPAMADFDRNLMLPWNGENELEWPALHTRLLFQHDRRPGISSAKLQLAPVTLRLRQGGETLRSHPNAATRTLKNLLQEQHVAPWHRDRMPLLYCGEKLVCVPGVAIAAEYLADGHESAIAVALQGR